MLNVLYNPMLKTLKVNIFKALIFPPLVLISQHFEILSNKYIIKENNISEKTVFSNLMLNYCALINIQ